MGESQLSDSQRKVLRAVFDALVPSVINDSTKLAGYYQRRGSDWLEAEDIVKALEGLSPAVQKEFFQLLVLLKTPLLGLTWAGPFKSFTRLSATQQEAMLQAWSGSSLGLLRKGFTTLKKLVTFLYYSKSKQGKNPNWGLIGYPGPLGDDKPTREKGLKLERPREGSVLTCEVLVIGSGAGGGVVAGELAVAGKDVLVVEKGPYLDRSEFSQLEDEMVEALYDGKGAMTTADGGVTVFAGSCLGGGTTVNWAGSFATPDYILEEWAREHDNPHLMEPAFGASLDAVAERIHVNTDYVWHNQQNDALRRGSEALGQQTHLIPRNERGLTKEDFRQLGFSPYGDRYGKKQGTLQTYLRDAADHGARLVASAEIERLEIAQGRVQGAIAHYHNGHGERERFRIEAKTVVVAAGAIHSPALLLRSGLKHPHLGHHLYFHPTVALTGMYGTTHDPSWSGPMMSIVNDSFTRLQGNYGFKLETPPAHLGLAALALPWQSGEQHKQMMLSAARMGHFIVLTRDQNGGRVTVDRYGKPVMQYRLQGEDLQHALKGMEEAAKIHLAAGAEEVIFPHANLMRMSAKMEANDRKAFFEGMPNWGWRPNDFALFSAHQMGTVRMGGKAKLHPVGPDGRWRDVQGLYVADASVFPSASGVNPMLTIMGLAHYIAQGIK